jgi:pimeloyl-ACP methyl ester carboxylesterase
MYMMVRRGMQGYVESITSWPLVPDLTGIVLLHPVGLDAGCWNLTGLSGITPEYPGNGGRPLPPSGVYTIEEVADEVAATTRGQLDLVGVSMGARVAEFVALRHPQRVRSMLLAAGGGAVQAPRRGPPTPNERAEVQLRSTMAETVDWVLQRWFSEDALKTPGHAGVEYVHRRWLANDPQGVAATWIANSVQVGDELATIKCPVTVIAGRFDYRGDPRAKPVEDGQALAAMFPLCQFEVIDGPHMLPLERPQEFAAAVRRHLDWVELVSARGPAPRNAVS